MYNLLVQDFGNQYTEEITKLAENVKLKELFKAGDNAFSLVSLSPFNNMPTLVLGIIQISSCPIFATRKEKCPLRTVTNAYTTIKEEGKYPVKYEHYFTIIIMCFPKMMMMWDILTLLSIEYVI
jgi:hypothetical protein